MPKKTINSLFVHKKKVYYVLCRLFRIFVDMMINIKKITFLAAILTLGMGSLTSTSASWFNFGSDKKEKEAWAEYFLGKKTKQNFDKFLDGANSTIKTVTEEKVPALEEAGNRIEKKIDVRLDGVREKIEVMTPIIEEAGQEIVKTSQMLTRLMQVGCVLVVLVIIRDFILPFTYMVAPHLAKLWIRLSSKQYRYDIDISPCLDDDLSPEIAY